MTTEQLAERARRAIARSGLTHAAVAAQTGIARATISTSLRVPSSRYGTVYARILAAVARESWTESRAWRRVRHGAS